MIIVGIGLTMAAFGYWILPARVVYINAPKVIEAYKRTSTVRKDLETRAGALQANADTLYAELEGEMKRYEQERPGLSEKENKLSLELLQVKREQFQRYQHSVKERISQESEKITSELLQEINSLIQAYAKKKGYGLVLGASGNGTIIYANELLDISDEVIAGINAD